MLAFAWCNYNYRPIRAKNLTWTTLIYLSALLWYIGNIACNGHVWLVGDWSKCKVWVLWFRVLFTFVFASLNIVRFFALDRVFNQKKPFTTRSNIVAFALVVVLNVTYCLVNHLISDSLTVEYVPSLEACNITMAFRIAALVFQWVLWTGVSVLIFRLRNIQSSFNEFYESIAIFAVVIALLIESTVVNIHYQYYVLERSRRIEKTVMDAAASNLIIWLIMAYPVVMCLFRRKSYERQWLERLADDNHNNLFTRVDDQDSGGLNNHKFNFISTGPSDNAHLRTSNPILLPATMQSDSAIGGHMDSRQGILGMPSIFDIEYPRHMPDNRYVL
ncbi:hypothetical protein H4R20_005698 [Coemansia guatemalensis]|uniref:Uncharacterized protein n=1 Tax=Coemansia guatemalensis TaxID=2761395 RepID=A0A9W8HP53_9FUNG|nr:hypothetical protein H4R20_005698 [Coemansia guatemalensis]